MKILCENNSLNCLDNGKCSIKAQNAFEKQCPQRSIGVDYIKTIAVLMVIVIHNISRLKIFDTISNIDFRIFLLIALKFLTLSSVPLFLIATGYLQNQKQNCIKHYKGLINILVSYAINAVICAGGKYLMDPNYTVTDAIFEVFNFTANDYSWYIEMFIGLFLLIPFLNKGFLQLGTIREKRLFVILLCVLTILPSVSSLFYENVEQYSMLPDYWVSLYPITYYIIGAYIAQHKPHMNKYLCLICIGLTLFATAFLIKLLSGELGYAWWVFNSNNGLPILFVSVFIFLLLYDINGLSARINLIIKSISVSTLDIYLYSLPVEIVLYKMVENLNLFTSVIFVFVFSYIIAKIKKYVFWKVLGGQYKEVSL